MDTPSNTTTNNVNSSRKCMKKRRRWSTKTRKVVAQGLINMAEARREIVNALQLHRSSSSSVSKSPSKLVEMNSSQYDQKSNNHYSPLIVPEPKGSSTTNFTSNYNAAGDENIEFEWPEIDRSFSSSSYSWWSSFLDSLDKNNKGCSRGVIASCKKVDNTFGTSYYDDFDTINEEGRVNIEGPFMETNSNDQNPFADEWLIVPTAEEKDI
ncbi:hypothetical protein LIER_05983 [Lithospermum erythrorhizon]|uniref:Uncharacterized protein n=1 Tax=Lithospermum erythrorhizon TaxID=34254 RepID=A0AAV3P3J1_LITER